MSYETISLSLETLHVTIAMPRVDSDSGGGDSEVLMTPLNQKKIREITKKKRLGLRMKENQFSRTSILRIFHGKTLLKPLKRNTLSPFFFIFTSMKIMCNMKITCIITCEGVYYPTKIHQCKCENEPIVSVSSLGTQTPCGDNKSL